MSIVCFTLCDITRTGFTRKPRTAEEIKIKKINKETLKHFFSLLECELSQLK